MTGSVPLALIDDMGALRAFKESPRNMHFNHAQHDVGVSAGAFVVARATQNGE